VVIAPLAAAADLSARGITIPPGADVDALLAAASDSVRAAAGCPITRVTSTVTVGAPDGQWLTLPGPVHSVDDVSVDGAEVTSWRLVDGSLWLREGWRSHCSPGVVTVTLTHGYDPVPADIVDLVCSLVASGASAVEAGEYESTAGLQSVKIDDYSETYETGSNAVTGRMELPKVTREWLRQRFAGSAFVTGSR
jgi:hypothetical protein